MNPSIIHGAALQCSQAPAISPGGAQLPAAATAQGWTVLLTGRQPVSLPIKSMGWLKYSREGYCPAQAAVQGAVVPRLANGDHIPPLEQRLAKKASPAQAVTD